MSNMNEPHKPGHLVLHGIVIHREDVGQFKDEEFKEQLLRVIDFYDEIASVTLSK